MRISAIDLSRRGAASACLDVRFMTVVAERVAPDSTLRKVGALIDWQRLAAVPVPVRSR